MSLRLCVCVCVLEYVHLFKASRYGDFGIHLLLMCYQHASFSNGAACETVHKTGSLKSPRSQNSCSRSGPLYLTDAQESRSRQATPRSATATDSGINKDGHPSPVNAPKRCGVFSARAPAHEPRLCKGSSGGPGRFSRPQLWQIPTQPTANLPTRNAGLWLCLF